MLLKLRLVLVLFCFCALANCQVNSKVIAPSNYKQLISAADEILGSYSDTLYKEDPLEHVKKYDLLDEARNLYSQAKDADTTQMYPTVMINDILMLMRNNEESQLNEEYNKVIKAADNAFSVKNYHKAKDLYKRALSFRPTDQYPKDIIVQIEDILQKTKD